MKVKNNPPAARGMGCGSHGVIREDLSEEVASEFMDPGKLNLQIRKLWAACTCRESSGKTRWEGQSRRKGASSQAANATEKSRKLRGWNLSSLLQAGRHPPATEVTAEEKVLRQWRWRDLASDPGPGPTCCAA